MVTDLRYLPSCPFCKRKISFLEVIVYKNKPCFKCRSCENFSHSSLKKGMNSFVIFSAMVLFGLFIVSVSFDSKFLILCFILSLVFFFVFYIILPIFIEFLPSTYIRKKFFKPKMKSKQTSKKDIRDKEFFNENDIFSN